MSTAETIKAAVVFRLGCGPCTARRHLEDVPKWECLLQMKIAADGAGKVGSP